ncbi:AAA family ATPase [Streptococcus salivarius]|uniref:AAA family ATPase n=1 Tax=Streptococcus salivarius TaxID=1304 RepID=UPI000A09339D|nr:SMC family ATPase [Streptococcus salivarius]ARI59738.1 ATP-dependent dsDNA exonuclease [Streptococcus salivarius]MBT9628719.1 AAA family ATPase [Streptococcus salivarius]MDU2003194.1 SMC family ATPase [Streptococcus salivarius]RGW72584.1 SMC family ATPase [Streptococcus salivarius]SQF75533.1 ATP-dependent dsDNA exonuclease [Streptococcus salivarius]
MRPVQLELTNFGPYRKEVINFTQFDHAPLFLIGGDTGAGKSTLFDAMTVALFATTSGDRNVEEMRSTFAGPEDDLTKVTFYFQQGNHLYRIERVLQQERAKRGGGTTMQKATASLVIVDKIGGQEIEKLGDKIKEVSDQIEQILGLNAEQFKQIILLPQNDFSRFLKEDSKTKTQILKKIFGTGIFDRFQKSLEERLRQSNKDTEKRQTQLDGHFTSQVWSEEELAVLAQTPASEKLARLEDLLAQRQENLGEQKSILKDAHEDLAKLQKSLQTAQDVAKIFQELEQAKERYRLEIEEGAQEQAEAKAHLEELQFAQGLQETISNLKQYQKQLLQLEQDLEIAQEKLKAKEQVFEEVKAQKEALAAQSEDFLQKERKLGAWKEAIIYAQSLAQEQEKIKQSSGNYKRLEETYQQASKEIELLFQSLSDLEANRLSLESLHEAEKLLQSVGYSVDKQLAQDLKEIEDLNQELAKTEKRHQTLSLDSDQAQEILKGLEEKLKTTLASRRQLMIAQLQAELEDGQPCMVCGSLEHPQVDGTQADEAALKDLMDQVEELQAQKEKQVATLSNRQARLSEVETKRQDLLDQVAKVKLSLQKHYQELEEQVKGQFDFDFSEDYGADRGQALLSAVEKHYQELQKRYEKEEADRVHYQDELGRAQEKATDLAKSYQEAKAALDQAKERLKDLKEAHPELESVEVYQERISFAKQELDLYNRQVKENGEAYNQLHADIQGIKGQLESLTKSKEKTSQEMKRLSAELDQRLMAEGALTNDLEQIQLWLLEVNKQAIPKLQAQLTTYQTLKQELQTQISKGQGLLQNQEKPDLVALTQEVQTGQESYDTQLSQVSVLEKGLKDATATYQAAKTLQDSNQEAFKAHQELSDLVKVVKGENTALTGRLNLEVYVIRQYFQQILDYANANYIGLLTDNRYSFVLSEEGRRARDHFGLDINVYDQLTGSERSVKSLSGGETFIAALAIALSLSEVVQNTSKGAVVEALFIDEGFGSLDKEALTKAIAVLEQIGENRMVGVISHVDDMKEGIAQQLAIIKSHDGSSRIKIVDKG